MSHLCLASAICYEETQSGTHDSCDDDLAGSLASSRVLPCMRSEMLISTESIRLEMVSTGRHKRSQSSPLFRYTDIDPRLSRTWVDMLSNVASRRDNTSSTCKDAAECTWQGQQHKLLVA